MNARKQISIEQLFRLYPQLRAGSCSEAVQASDEYPGSDARNVQGPEEQVRERCMET